MSTDNLTADVFAKILPAGRDRALMRAALRLLDLAEPYYASARAGLHSGPRKLKTVGTPSSARVGPA